MQVKKFIPLAFLLFGCGLMPLSVSTQAATQNGPLPTDTPPASTPMKLSTGLFTLTIFSPADQAVVNQPQVDIRGDVSADAVVTINEDTYVFNSGPFKQTIPLEDGLNSIQIVASDMEGNEVDLILTVTYQPE
jgi:hypothetical protein